MPGMAAGRCHVIHGQMGVLHVVAVELNSIRLIRRRAKRPRCDGSHRVARQSGLGIDETDSLITSRGYFDRPLISSAPTSCQPKLTRSFVQARVISANSCLCFHAGCDLPIGKRSWDGQAPLTRRPDCKKPLCLSRCAASDGYWMVAETHCVHEKVSISIKLACSRCRSRGRTSNRR